MVMLAHSQRKSWKQGRLSHILPLHPGPEETDILQTQSYKIHQRAAKLYVMDPVLLADDAAYVNNPVGGRGFTPEFSKRMQQR